MTPRHRESDTTVDRGAITKQGSRLVRWAAVEALQRTRVGTPMRARYAQVLTRRGATAKHVANVAAARERLEGRVLRPTRWTRPPPGTHQRGMTHVPTTPVGARPCSVWAPRRAR